MSGKPDGPTPNPTTPAPSVVPTPPAPTRSTPERGQDPVEPRDDWKHRATAAEAKLAELERRDADTQRKAELDELEALRKDKAERLQQDEQRARQDRRKATSDAILEHAHPDHKAALAMMLPGLHEAKKIDLYAEGDEAGAKAREALEKDFPQYFSGAEGATSAGNPGRPAVNLEGITSPAQLTEEQRARGRLSPCVRRADPCVGGDRPRARHARS